MKTRTLSIVVLLSFFAVVPGVQAATDVVPGAQAATYLATYTVNQLGDTGTGQGFSGDLRYCLTQANANSPGPNLIKFQPGLIGTIHLTTALPALLNKLTIQGPGANNLTVNAYGSSVVSVASGATIFLSGLTLTGGLGNGGGIYISRGSMVTLNNVAPSGDAAPMGSLGR